MAERKSSKSAKKTLVNYSLNISILILVGICVYLAFSLASKSFSTKKNTSGEITDTNSNLTKQPNLTIQLDVKNATGENGVAKVFTDYLRQKGFDVVEMGNYDSSDEPKTIIIDRNGKNENCKKVAYTLGVNEKNIIQQLNESMYLDATVVIGKDYKELTPYLNMK